MPSIAAWSDRLSMRSDSLPVGGNLFATIGSTSHFLRLPLMESSGKNLVPSLSAFCLVSCPDEGAAAGILSGLWPSSPW